MTQNIKELQRETFVRPTRDGSAKTKNWIQNVDRSIAERLSASSSK